MNSVPPPADRRPQVPVTAASTVAPAAEWRSAPTLTGTRVTLRALQRADAGEWLGALGDEAAAREAWAWMTVTRPESDDDAQRIVDDHLARVAAAASVCFTQVDNATGEVAGLTTYYDIDPSSRALAIGWTWLGKRHWASGINSESKFLLLQRAFDELGAARVVWHVDIRNERSRAAVRKLGATQEGVLRKHRIRPDGSWRDTVQFSMTDDDWPAARARLVEVTRHRRSGYR